MNKHYKQEYDEVVYQFCKDTHGGIREVAEKLKVSKSTIDNWKKKYPSFAESIRNGKKDFYNF